MNRGMLVCIYRSDYDSKCNRLYGYKSAVLIGDGIPEIFEPSDDAPAIILKNDRPCGRDYFKAEPAEDLPDGHVGWMMGGTYVVTSDSRWPFEGPIPLHDRSESQRVYDALSV